MGDVTSRRGRVDGMEPRGNAQVVKCLCTTFRNVRLCNIITFKHSRSWYLHYVHFDHYAEVPKSIAEDIIKKNKGE